MNFNAVVRIGCIAVLAVTLAACQGKIFTGQGNFVPEEKRIVLAQEGSESGSWQGKNDLTVNYTITRNQDVLQIAGDIEFHRHKLLDTFRFSIVLIDSDGNVLEVAPVASAGGRREVEQVAFSREVTLPPNTRSFAFTYSGTTRGTGQGGSPTSFWSAPW